ncbi:hypothetical protein ES332_D10G281100v1 [Gossypium tomentosum]|uniref:Uncharacterized protein n=1 Tax=Gossypium tomentosum TaxID=34277 RepID=A0A5D2JAW1_GOSTO|nr:hypothetical protein ES332_D10G281100v1 [Gossypium tomentosum]
MFKHQHNSSTSSDSSFTRCSFSSFRYLRRHMDELIGSGPGKCLLFSFIHILL